MAFYQRLAKKIKTARIEAGLSQAELSERAKTTQQTISALENGQRRPSVFLLNKVCKATGKSYEWFLNGEADNDATG